MTGAPVGTVAWARRNAIRIVLLINFLLLVAWFGPLNNQKVYQALRDWGVLDAEVLAEQIWIVFSTLFATGFFFWRLVGRQKTSPTATTVGHSPVVDGVLLFAWWIALLGICAYAFMLGMAG
jgi:hypothetical protein